MKQKREYIDYLQDILDAAQKAEQFHGRHGYGRFRGGCEDFFAVIRALEIIGEATKHIPHRYVSATLKSRACHGGDA